MSEEDRDLESTTEKALVPMGANGLAPQSIDEMWRYGKALSRSDIVPRDVYFSKPDNCFIALDLAQRTGCHWLTIMQHVYIVHGRPAMDAQLSTALCNKSGLFVDPLEYEVEGDNPQDKAYRVRAYATRNSTGKMLHGPWIDWNLVRGEGWYDKAGSKWKTMPEQMFHYRAASWFQKRFCPEVTMGMMTVDEARDIPERKTVDSTEVPKPKGVASVAAILKEKQDTAAGTEQTEPSDAAQEAEQTAKDKFGTPEEVEKGKDKSQKKTTPESTTAFTWTCKSKTCGIGFDDPQVSGDAALCPKCLTKEIEPTDIDEDAFDKALAEDK